MSAAARAAVPAAPHCPPQGVRRVAVAPARGSRRRAAARSVALRVTAVRPAPSSGAARRKRSVSNEPQRDRRSAPSLDAFLAEQGGAGALLGYGVVHAESGKLLGTAREVLTVAGGEVVFKASGDGAAAADQELLLDALAGFSDWGASVPSSAESTLLRVEGAGREYAWEFFLPLATALVPAVDTRRRQLRVLPPAGLLDAGDAERLLDWLRTELEPYLKRPKSNPTGTSLYMPSLAELRRLGRNDLIMAMERAGGCSTVAAQLRLLGVRKPVGYWDEPEILEQELREFVASHWQECFEDGDDTRPFYHNAATGEMRWVMPRSMRRAQPDSSSEGEDEEEEEEEERTMPSTTAMQKAGRYDLYKAVTMFGGVTEVAEMLGWRPRLLARDIAEQDTFVSFSALAAELRAFAAKAGAPGMMPCPQDLRKAGRMDVVTAVRRRGSFAAVARRAGLIHRSSITLTLPQTVAGLRNYLMETTAEGAPPRADMPTDAELRKAGQKVLAAAIVNIGRLELGKLLRLRGTTRAMNFVPFAAAREYAHTSGCASIKAWREMKPAGKLPPDIPAAPEVVYKNSGWAGWPDFLRGTPGRARVKRKPYTRKSATRTSA